MTVAYGAADWSRPEERAANIAAIPAVRSVELPACGHFSALERQAAVAALAGTR
jgi:pimeloyl-ACP methyl ester carboxylesterase